MLLYFEKQKQAEKGCKNIVKFLILKKQANLTGVVYMEEKRIILL